MGKLGERFKLNLKFMGSSKRLAIITIIGLSISIAMVTQNLLFLGSFRDSAFNEFSSTVSDTHIDAQLEDIRFQGYTLRSLLESTIENGFEESDMSVDYLSHQEWITYRFFYMLLYNDLLGETEFHDTYIIGVDDSYLELLEEMMLPGGVSPGYGQFCLITDTKTLAETNIAINDTYNVYIQMNDDDNPWVSYQAGLGVAGQVIGFSGIINIDDVSYGSIPIPVELQTLINLVLALGKELIITSFNYLPDFLSSIIESDDEFSVFGRLVFDLQRFNVFELDEQLAQLQILVNNLQESLLTVASESVNQQLILNPYVLPLLSGFKLEYRIFQTFLLLFMLPTLGMSLALTTFASNQVKKKRDMHIGNYHQRGASRQMLFSFMFVELLVFSFLATLIGFLIGWPYTMVALKSDTFFSFNAAASFPIPNIKILALCLGIGFGIAWFWNIFSIWKKTKTSVDEALQERVEKSPFWERFYVDIFLVILGLLMWIISFAQLEGGSATAIEFAFYFAAPAPILIIVGAIMLITRIYPTIVRTFSNLIFKVRGFELSAVSIRNAIRRKGSTTRTIILLTLTFTLTVATMIVPDSYQAFDEEDSYYHLGADIVVKGVNVQSDEYKSSILALEGVESACYVSVLDISNSESDLLYTIKLLGVELDNFSSVAFQEDEYTNGQGINTLLASINNESDVIANLDQVELLNLENDTFTIDSWQISGSDILPAYHDVKVVDYYVYWPTLHMDRISPTAKEIPVGFIGNISLPFKVARTDSEVDGQLYVKVMEGYSTSEVASQIEIQTQHQTENIEDELLISEGTLKATVLFGALNSSLFMSMLISAATLITMMLVQGMEREKEIAIMKSFGINRKQLFNFFISEALVVLVFTMIVGTALGFGTAAMIMKILRIEAALPVHEMVYPWVKIILTTLAIFGIGLISTIIPIIVNIRKKIGGSLKSI